MTPKVLASIVAVILSILASYLPGFSAWFETLTPNYKRLLMLGLLALTALGSFGLACADLAAAFGIALVCDQAGAIELLQTFAAAVIANQTAYLVVPQPITPQRSPQSKADPKEPRRRKKSTNPEPPF